MPKGVPWGFSLSSLPSIPGMAWHASPAEDGEDVCPSTGMVASGMCVLLVWYQSSFKNNQAGRTAAAGKITGKMPQEGLRYNAEAGKMLPPQFRFFFFLPVLRRSRSKELPRVKKNSSGRK